MNRFDYRFELLTSSSHLLKLTHPILYFCFQFKMTFFFFKFCYFYFCKPPQLFKTFKQAYLFRDIIHLKVPPLRMALARDQSLDQNPHHLPPPVGCNLQSNQARGQEESKPRVRLIGGKIQSSTESEEVDGRPKSKRNLMRAAMKIPVRRRSGRIRKAVQVIARSLPGVRRIFHRRSR